MRFPGRWKNPAPVMKEVWNLSLLIDGAGGIREARGMTAHHLGVELHLLLDRYFSDFVTPGQRAWFRRCLAKLRAGEPFGLSTVDLITGAPTPQPYYLSVRPGNVADRWWLMLSTDLPPEMVKEVQKPTKPALASGAEFMLLVESAAQAKSEELDLMRVTAGALSASSGVSGDVRSQLESDFNRIVLDNSFDGIASRIAAGEYLLLRERSAGQSNVLEQLTEAASNRAVSSEALGLNAGSLPVATLGKTANAGNIAKALEGLRNPRPTEDFGWEGIERKRPLWRRPTTWAACLAALALLWFLR